MTIETSAPRSRRALLLGGLGAAAAAGVAALGRAEPAAAAGAVQLGAVNVATGPTEVRSTGASTSAVALVGSLTHSTGSSSSAGVRGSDAGVGGTGVAGVANAGTGARGVLGTSTAGRGVQGVSTSGIGVLGTSNNFRGVQGFSTSGAGVYGNSTSGSGVYGKALGIAAGVYGTGPETAVQGYSPAGYGVFGQSDTSTGVFGFSAGYAVAGLSSSTYGVFGQTASTGGGAGVHGKGPNLGVDGLATATGGIAVKGSAFGDASYGVFGDGDGVGGVGVYGRANGTNGFGVLGRAEATNSFGVWGSQGTLAALAGYFDGDVFISGVLNGHAVLRRLDHPDSPGERWYTQALVGSFEQVDVIGGNAVTGSDGRVTVAVPALFARHHRDVRYQLTPIGRAPELHVERELDAKGRFTIAADRPGLRVSWQLTGVRSDPAALRAPLRVDSVKPARYKGRYSQPALYGQPRSKSLATPPKTPRRTRAPRLQDLHLPPVPGHQAD